MGKYMNGVHPVNVASSPGNDIKNALGSSIAVTIYRDDWICQAA